jgi:hypothetical protein
VTPTPARTGLRASVLMSNLAVAMSFSFWLLLG